MATRAGSEPIVSEPPTDQVSQAAGRYLLELYWLSLDVDGRVGMGRIGDRLDVSPASVTEMVAHLDEADLVEYRKHQGVALTDGGTAVGAALAWRYCVVERFFQSMLDADLDVSTTYELGYRLPDEGVRTLGQKLEIPCMRACDRTTPPSDRSQHQSTAGS